MHHGADQGLQIRRAGSTMDDDGGLIVESRLEGGNGCSILVGREGILVLYHGIGIVEEPRGRRGPGIENDRSNIRWYRIRHISCRSSVVGIHVACSGVVDLVEKDAGDGDVGLGVGSPSGIDVNLRGQGGVRNATVVGGDIAKGDDVAIAVQLGERGDVVCVGGICAWARIRVDDNLPLNFGVGGDGGCDIGPGRGRGSWVKVERKQDEERVARKGKDEGDEPGEMHCYEVV